MAGRGRGRLSRNILSPVLPPGETIPGPTPRGQPPPPYPNLEHQPAPMVLSPAIIIQHAWKEDFLVSFKKNNHNYHWTHFPNELKPGPGRVRKASTATNKNLSKISKSIDQYFEKLEKHEIAAAKVKIEVQDPEEEKENEGEEMMEEDEEDTDYNQNYFDNGESYLDEDDDDDEGPVY